jgi:uncharacterized protein YbbC (DUF1343 family)
MKLIRNLFGFLLIPLGCIAQNSASPNMNAEPKILAGADRIPVYLPLIKGRSVGIFANQTSMVGNTHLVDTLSKLGVNIKVIFGPEHGFRGTADAGEKVGNYTDEKTGIPVISLYGTKRRPSADDVKDVDILIFDIQDVGVRFYTFISSLEEFMEAAFEHRKPLMILDRPNPNGFYVDGPVLEKTKYKSFVGMQAIPIVYGMTIAEYAMMIAGENWLSPGANARYEYYRKYGENSVDTPFHFQVIKCANYTHKSKYVLPVRPSPNLPNIQSIYLYPSTCLFEGTVLSEGRGTTRQFQVFGHPSLPKNLYSFTPNPNEGAKNSKLYGQLCYGWDLSGTPESVLKEVENKVQLRWIMEAYKLFPQKDSFFIIPKSGDMEKSSIVRLSGNNELWQQIRQGRNEDDIRKSWEPALGEFKKIRKKYLLYADFE